MNNLCRGCFCNVDHEKHKLMEFLLRGFEKIVDIYTYITCSYYKL